MWSDKIRSGGRGTRPESKRFDAAARAAMAGNVRAGAAAYDRARCLPGLIRIDAADIGDDEAAVRSVLSRLKRALRVERTRGRAGHWTYDLNRHIALRQAYDAEAERLAAFRRERR